MISLADNRGFKKVITWKDLKVKLDYVKVVESEREMLKRFVELVEERDVDILLGYNTDLFDFPYLRERAKQLRVKLKLGRDGSEVIARKRRFATATRIRGRVHIDVYTMVNFLATIGTIRLIHYTLEDVYRHMLGREKPDFKFTEMAEAWEQGGERAKELLEYCMSDSQATLELGLELLPLFFELTRIIRQTPFDVTRMTPGQLVEWLLIADARKVGELVPARPVGEEYAERLEETYVGAYVMEPAKGLHEDLIVFDFRSLYPSIIVSHNIDPSTLNCKCCKPSEATTVPELDYRFCGRRKGFISSTLERLIEARAKLKRELKQHKRGTKEYRSLDSQQWALKIVANSVDGNEPVVLRDPSGRIQIKNIGSFVDKFITEACTQHVGNTEVADPPAKWEALSFNGTNMMFTPIKKVIRHPAPETLYEVKLSSGKKVRVTADHSVFVLDQDLNAMPIETRALKPGDYILAPRKVPTKPYAQDTLNLIQEFSKLAPELLEDICIYVDRRPRRGVIETRIRILELLSDRKPRHISQIGEKIGRGSRCISKNAASLIREGYLREVRRRRNLRIVEITEKGSRRLQIEKTLLEHLKYDGSKRRHFIFINNLKPIVGLLNDEEIRTWSVGVYRHGRKFSPIIKITPEFFRLLGYFISEGSGYIAQNPRGGRSYSISIANEDEEIRRDIINCIKTTFGGEPYVWRKGIMITQKVPYLALSAVLNMDLKAGEKRIPELVLNSPTEHQLAFLHAYWRGDGSYRESTGQYVFTTKSGKLITDLSFLLSQLGVCVTLVEDSGVHRAIVNEDLPFKPSTAINRRSYSHVVPGKLMIPLLKGMRKVKKYPHVLQGKNMRIEKALELVNEFLKTNPGDEYANRLLKFLTGDLLLEKIIEINAVKPSTEYVYDLSVEGNENFVGGHGLVCLHNSFYGMLGYPRARWYFKECAESVTSFGRHYIRKTIDMARDFDFDVIYSDTDSLYCKLNGKKREDAMKFLKQVNESLPGIMELEFEGFYPRGIFVTKKRYAMIDEEGRMVVKGLEFVRRDWAALAKKTQEAALEAILRDGSPKKAAEIVRRTTRDVLEGKVSLNDLVIYTQLKMPIESYRSIGPHVVAAKRLRELGREVEPGMMIAYIEAKGPGSISERAVPVEDFKGREYDPDYYVEHQVLPAVMRIMEVLGYREEDLRYEREKQMDLEKFMR
jgi:DNA polymerase I